MPNLEGYEGRIEDNRVGYGLPSVVCDMLNPETFELLHGHIIDGDEEAIEACSDELIPALQPHFEPNTGKYNQQSLSTDTKCVELLQRLHEQHGSDSFTKGVEYTTAMLRSHSGITK